MDPAVPPKIVDAIQKNNCTLLKSIIEADESTKKNINSAIFLQEYPKGYNFLLPNENLTLLHICAVYDSFECFILLIDDYNFELRILSADSFFPLHYACLNGSFEVASYILDKDPDQAKLLPGGISHHFLYLSAVGGDPNILKELFRCGANMNERANKIDDPIAKAIGCSNIQCLKIFLNHGSNTASGDMTPAMKAIVNNRDDAVMLLIDGSQDIKKTTSDGKTIISLCCFYGMKFKNTVFNILRIIGNDVIEIPAHFGAGGVCHWICEMGDLDVANALLATKDVDINRLDSNGCPGPFKLVDRRDLDAKNVISLLRLLIYHGFNVNVRRTPINNNMPKTPTLLEKFLIAMRKMPDVIEFLIDNGADLYAVTSNTNKQLYEMAISRGGEIGNIVKKKMQKE